MLQSASADVTANGRNPNRDLLDAETSERPARAVRCRSEVSASDDIAAFVAKAQGDVAACARARSGRLVFALDATMSRQPTWDMACALQADMFREAAALGSLDIRLVYYRGLNECRATGWISDSAQLAKLMGKIDCRGGNTQIGKVLSETRREAVASAVRAVVFVGDAMEEKVDDLCVKAGELGLLKVPVFMFQEGHDAVAERAFREIARLTGGAWCRFDPGAAAQLRELLRAAAAYAAGGREALLRLSKAGERSRQTARPDEVIAIYRCGGLEAGSRELPRRRGFRDRIQRGGEVADRGFGSAQPVPLCKPRRIIVGKPGIAGGVLPTWAACFSICSISHGP